MHEQDELPTLSTQALSTPQSSYPAEGERIQPIQKRRLWLTCSAPPPHIVKAPLRLAGSPAPPLVSGRCPCTEAFEGLYNVLRRIGPSSGTTEQRPAQSTLPNLTLSATHPDCSPMAHCGESAASEPSDPDSGIQLEDLKKLVFTHAPRRRLMLVSHDYLGPSFSLSYHLGIPHARGRALLDRLVEGQSGRRPGGAALGPGISALSGREWVPPLEPPPQMKGAVWCFVDPSTASNNMVSIKVSGPASRVGLRGILPEAACACRPHG